MQTKVILFFAIIILTVLLLHIKDSRKRLRQNNPHARSLTMRSLLLIGAVMLILFFSLLR